MSLAQLITIVLARRRAALCLLGGLVLLVFVYSELQPRKYLANAAVMIDAHLADPVAARTGRVVLSSVQAVGDPSAHLGGELRGFGLDAGTRQAVVTFDASLIRVPGKTGVEKQRFEARVPVATIDAAAAGPALNDAANQVASQVADWVGR